MSGIFCLKWWNWNGIYQHTQVCDTKLSQCCYRKYLPKSTKNYLMKCDYEHVLIKNKTSSTENIAKIGNLLLQRKKLFFQNIESVQLPHNQFTWTVQIYSSSSQHTQEWGKNEHKRCTDEKNHKIQTALSWVAQNFFFSVFCFKLKKRKKR